VNEWLAQLGATVGAALRWWVGELAGLVPGWVRRSFANGRSRLVLILQDDSAMLAYDTAEGTEVLGRFAPGSGQVAEMQQFLASSLRGNRSAEYVVIRLPADQALRSQMLLPAAAARNLDQVVAFEFERHTPFRREDVYFTHRVLRRDTALRRLHIELTSVPRAVVEDALRLAQQIGLRVEGVEVAGTEAAPAVSANLLPEDQRRARRRISDLALGGSMVLALSLAIVAVAIPLIQATSAERALSRRVDEAKRQAEASLQLQKEIDAEALDSSFLIVRRHQTPTVSELLDALTRLVPDDTWLTDLKVTASSVQLTGYANSATTLLRLLDTTAGFSEAAFGSSVTQDPKLNREQFFITAKIMPRTDP
jgi:general secretion pathway protein L